MEMLACFAPLLYIRIEQTEKREDETYSCHMMNGAAEVGEKRLGALTDTMQA